MVTKTYTVIRSIRVNGRALDVGETITMSNRQAQYLIGTHLEPGQQNTPSKSVKRNKGDQQ